MSKLYRTAVEGGLKLSPLWDDEAVVFNPASAEIFVVTESAARLLKAVQDHAVPVPVADLAAQLQMEPPFHASAGLQDEIESMLLELEHLGFIESALP